MSPEQSLDSTSIETRSIGKIIKNAIWLIVQPLILNLISIAVTGYIARVLGVEDFGIFNFAFLSFIPMFIALTGLGLSSVAVRDLARDKSEADIYIGRILTIRIIISTLTWLISAILIIVMDHPFKTVVVVWIAGAMILIQAFTRTHEDLARAYEQMKSIAVRDFWSGILLTAFSVIVLLFGGRLYALSLSYIAGSLVALFLALYYSKKYFVFPKLNWDWKFVKYSIKSGVFFYLAGLVILINDRIDVTLLTQIILYKKLSLKIVGYYSSAILLLSKLWIIPNALQAALYPTLSSAWKENKELAGDILSRFFSLIVAISLPASIGLMLIAEPVMNLIYGQSYKDGIYILELGSLLIVLWSINLNLGVALGAANREKYAFIINLIGLILTLILGVPLSYYMLHKGMITARILGQTIVLFLSIAITFKVFSAKLELKRILFVIASTTIMGIGVYFTNKLHFTVAIVTGGIIYTILTLGLKVITIDEIKSLMRRH